ncbi:GNAT family N-acetyltransferase [Archangium violaceum]|uniref:GNAT family N-acetyltransferase n=1 Tax=Archangium violaceum TaxID=83451 RepID=UPI001952994C|nr:GNAT family N-acetyltransferase [Archangium violaceum]QRN96184.1 GNAT family N-acetyltransferase [Archangium violaceum]
MALSSDLGAPRLQPARAPAHLEVEEVVSPRGLEQLRGEWRWLWARCPGATTFQRPEWLLPWYRHFGPGFSPRPPWVVTLRSEGRLVGLAPLAIREEEGARVVRLLGEGLSDSLDVLMDPSLAPQGVRALFDWLARNDERWDLCVFEQLREDSPLLATPVPPGWGEHSEAREVCPRTILPWAAGGRLAAILSQARHRLEQLGPVRIEEANEGNLDAMMDSLFRLRGMEDATLQSFHREVARGLLAARALRQYTLHVNERPVAVFHGFQDGAHVRYHLGGADPDFERYHVGHLVIAHALEEAARSGATVFDFPRGSEPARYLWGARESRDHRRSVWHGPETKM